MDMVPKTLLHDPLNGFNVFIYVLADNGMGNWITRHKLNQKSHPLVNYNEWGGADAFLLA